MSKFISAIFLYLSNKAIDISKCATSLLGGPMSGRGVPKKFSSFNKFKT